MNRWLTLPRERPLLLVGAVVWVLLVGAGSAWLSHYGSQPGPSGAVPTVWPAADMLPRSAARATVVVVAHPRCACSRATVRELERVLARRPGKADVHIVFFKPAHESDAWLDGALWLNAQQLPQATVHIDTGGALARRFGALTSGHVLVYTPEGRLAFSGGITPGRGHEGASPGRSAVLAILAGATPDYSETPVYGCLLTTEDTAT